MPDMPTAAPAAPSAPSAPSAPVSAPVSSTPSTPAAPPPTPVPATPSTPAPVETPAPPAVAVAEKPVPPKQEDFKGNLEGYLKAKYAYEREHGDIPPEVKADPAPAAEKTPEQIAAEAATEVKEPPKAEPKPEDITPEALNGWMERSEKLREALESDPELKGAMFQMARVNAKLAPIGEIFPTVEAATFANETANTFVGLRHSFLRTVENPESIGEVYGQLAEQFVERDAQGQPMKDANGDPVYGEDFHMLNDFIFNSGIDVEMEDLQEAINGGRFATEKAKEDANLLLEAFKFIKAYREKGLDELDKPDTSQMTPEQKAYFDRREKELADEREKLGLNKKASTAEAKKAERAAYMSSVWSDVGKETGQTIKRIIEEKSANGVYIPSYVLEVKDSEGRNVFGMNCYNKFISKIKGSSAINNELAKLEMLPPSPENRQRYASYVNGLVHEYLPAIVDAEQKAITKKAVSEVTAQNPTLEDRQRHAQVEPRGGSTSKPKEMTSELAWKQAREFVDKNFPGIPSNEREAKVISKKNEILGRNYV